MREGREGQSEGGERAKEGVEKGREIVDKSRREEDRNYVRQSLGNTIIIIVSMVTIKTELGRDYLRKPPRTQCPSYEV